MATIPHPLVKWRGRCTFRKKFEISKITRHAPFNFEGKKSDLKGQNRNPRGPPWKMANNCKLCNASKLLETFARVVLLTKLASDFQGCYSI